MDPSEKFKADLASRLNAIRAGADGPVSSVEADNFQSQESDLDSDAIAEQMRVANLATVTISNRELEENIELRKKYGIAVFCLLCVWVTAVLGTVIASGWEECPLDVEDNVLIALIAGVSVNIIGLFAVVVNFLFPNK